MPDIKFAAADVAAMKHGATNVSKVMLGTVEVWPGAPVCTDVLAEPFNNLTAWTGTASIVAGRTGTAASLAGAASNATYDIAGPAQLPHATIGFAYKVSQVGANTRTIFSFRDTAAIRQITLRVELDGRLSLYTGSGTNLLGQSAAGAIVAATWYYLEVQIFIDAVVGSAVVRINGTPVVTVSGVNTLTGGALVNIGSVMLFGPGTGVTSQFDDLYLSTGPGCAFKGDHTIP